MALQRPGRFLVVPNTAEPAELYGESFDVLQSFDGTVTGIVGDDVSVTLRDLTDPSNPDEDAELSLRQFDQPERVAVGAAFYLTIGYRERRSGRELVTLVRIRTIVPPSAAQRARAEREAGVLQRYLTSG
jgi:hypothetical protein